MKWIFKNGMFTTEDEPEPAPAPTLKHVSQLTAAEADQQLADHMAGLAESDGQRRNGLPKTPGPKWTPEEIAAGEARAAAAKAAKAEGPLPAELRDKDARMMSPVEHDRAARALGLERQSTAMLMAEQHAWEKSHGRE